MIKRYLITCIFIVSAATVAYTYYINYNDMPWTRDGQVRANIVQITPRVTGQITKMNAQDNSHVNKGDVLFEIDKRPYAINLNKANANQQQMTALLNKAKNEANRSINLEHRSAGALSSLVINNLNNAVDIAKANLKSANAIVADAELQLKYTIVIAPTDGFITNLNYQVGSQVIAHSPVVALIDENSFWIEGFFKENDLKGVSNNDQALVVLMSDDDVVLAGKVESIGFGIAKHDGTTGNALLPNVSPNFQWIRLAQRLPVKIKLTNLPKNLQLRVGTTASVKIIKQKVQ